jgi:hypothetical protein
MVEGLGEKFRSVHRDFQEEILGSGVRVFRWQDFGRCLVVF